MKNEVLKYHFRCIKDRTLTVREVAVLTEFYRERLKDSWEVHGAVMEGMTYLARQQKYPGSGMLSTYTKNLFKPGYDYFF